MSATTTDLEPSRAMKRAASTSTSDEPTPPTPLAGRRVTVLGLGSFGGGVAVTRFLVEAGARVTVTDQKRPEDLGPSLRALADLDVRLVLGEHRREDVLEADLVVKNPAIPLDSPWVKLAEDAGVPITSELVLGLEQLSQRGIPYAMVTGSKGKTTTSTLLGAMGAQGSAPCPVAGNNERPLLAALSDLVPGARCVLEVSSFMAEDLLRARRRGQRFRRPEALVFTLLEPEHLNWHGTVEAYYGSKLSLLDLRPRTVIFPAADAELASRVPARAGDARLVRVAPDRAPGPGVELGVSSSGLAATDTGEVLFDLASFQVLGAHNRGNALLAAAAARALGAAQPGIAAAVAGFRALDHRLEPCGTSPRGVRFVNDSTATTPAAAMAALEAVPGPLVLIAGGSDKGHDFTDLGRAAAAAHAVVCIGVVRERIAAAIEAAGGPARLLRAETFDQAVALAEAACPDGGAVLLAPATASYDMFPNFKARGERFRALARSRCA